MQWFKSLTWEGTISALTKFPESLIRWVTGFLEFLTDHMHTSLAHIMIKASPLLAPAPSAIAIYGSLETRFGPGAAWVMTFVFEALGFAAVYAKTKLEEHNRANPDNKLSTDKADWAIMAYFTVSELSILLFEVVPAWALYIGGESDVVTALIHTAPMVFPIFSYIGANIYALMDILTGIGEKVKAQVDNEIGNLQIQLAAVMAELGEVREKHATEIGALREAHRAQLAEVAAVAKERLEDAVSRTAKDVAAEYEPQLAEMRAELRLLRRYQEAASAPAMPSRQTASDDLAQPIGDLSVTERQRIGEIAKILASNRVENQEQFIAVSGWSSRTAQRYWAAGVKAGVIYKNGDDAYHARV